MLTFVLQDNESEQFIPIQPITPQLALYIKEESKSLTQVDYNANLGNNSSNSSPNSLTSYNYLNSLASGNGLLINTKGSPTDYIGATTIDIPYNVLDQYAVFQLYDYQSSPPANLSGTVVGAYAVDLFPSTDTNPRITTAFDGLQFIRIPANIFNDLDTDGNVTNKRFGKYYIRICPKYIDVPVTGLLNRNQLDMQALASYISTNGIFPTRRQTIKVNNTGFFSTPWRFEDQPFQQGRLYGSIVEIWDSNKVVKKQQRVLNEDQLTLGTKGTDAFLVLSPELVGMESAQQATTVGDIIRIYPRETYFKPIVIEINYSAINSATDLVRFMMNDVVQDVTRGIYEVYDENGVTSDGQGNISGNVVLSYQISQEGNYQIRRKNPVATSVGNTIQDLGGTATSPSGSLGISGVTVTVGSGLLGGS